MSCNLPDEFIIGLNMSVVNKRFAFGFGGMNDKIHSNGSIVRVLRLDTMKLKKGW